MQGRFGKPVKKKKSGKNWNQQVGEDHQEEQRDTSQERKVFLDNHLIASLKACLQKDTTELRLKAIEDTTESRLSAIEKRLIQMHDGY